MSALTHANTQLQSRFSPALGKRTAEIFGRLTGGAYGGVVLDRALHVSAEPAGSGVPRDVDLLSAGAADQLYLAVRLAVCDLVLPPENAAPIVLDGSPLQLRRRPLRRRPGLSAQGGGEAADPALHLPQPGGGLFPGRPRRRHPGLDGPRGEGIKYTRLF